MSSVTDLSPSPERLKTELGTIDIFPPFAEQGREALENILISLYPQYQELKTVEIESLRRTINEAHSAILVSSAKDSSRILMICKRSSIYKHTVVSFKFFRIVTTRASPPSLHEIGEASFDIDTTRLIPELTEGIEAVLRSGAREEDGTCRRLFEALNDVVSYFQGCSPANSIISAGELLAERLCRGLDNYYFPDSPRPTVVRGFDNLCSFYRTDVRSCVSHTLQRSPNDHHNDNLRTCLEASTKLSDLFLNKAEGKGHRVASMYDGANPHTILTITAKKSDDWRVYALYPDPPNGIACRGWSYKAVLERGKQLSLPAGTAAIKQVLKEALSQTQNSPTLVCRRNDIEEWKNSCVEKYAKDLVKGLLLSGE